MSIVFVFFPCCFKLDGLAIRKASILSPVMFQKWDENTRCSVVGDEAVAFFAVEPFLLAV